MSIFTKIINGEIPCYKIAEDEHHLAFLDINPLKKGHTLVVPKQEVDYIFDMEDTSLAALQIFAKRTANAIKKVVDCKKIGIAVVGLEVPHAHIHLIPINQVSEMDFSKAKLTLNADEMQQLATTIARNF